MAYILLLVLLVLLVFSISPLLGILFLLIVVVFMVFEISRINDENEKNIEAIKVGKDKAATELAEISFIAGKRIDLHKEDGSSEFLIDIESDRLAICDYLQGTCKVLPFSSLVDCEIVENNITVLNSGVGRAIIGGAIAGSTGAVVGATTAPKKAVVENLTIKIVTSNIIEPLITIPIITKSTVKNSEAYKEKWLIAQEVHSTLVSIIKSKK